MQTTKNEARDRAEMFALLVTQENIYEELRNNPADYTIQEAEELLDRINKKIIHEEEQHEIRDAISA